MALGAQWSVSQMGQENKRRAEKGRLEDQQLSTIEDQIIEMAILVMARQAGIKFSCLKSRRGNSGLWAGV
jgi:hypothetical protein